MARTWSPPPLTRRINAPWDDHEVIRSELFSRERFEEHAVSLADGHILVRRAPRVVNLLDRLEDDSRALARAQKSISASLAAGQPITPAAEWLVDNFHTVEKHISQVRRDLPVGYFRELPTLGSGFLEGHPRIFSVVWAYVAHTDSLFDPDLLATYVDAYEDRKALSLGELWAVPITLRLLLIENLRRIADQVVAAADERYRANELADRLLGIDGSAPVPVADAVPAGFELPGRGFAVQLLRRLSGSTLHEPLAWLGEQLAAKGWDPTDILYEAHQSQARTTVTVSNIIASLRLVGDINWEDWLESVSLVEEVLRTDEGYVGLDFASRNLYRSAVEDIARGSGQQEVDIARAVMQRAHAHDDEVLRDLGYWLIDDGRRELERAVGYRVSWRRRISRGVRRLGLPGYLGALTAVTLLLLAITIFGINRLSPEVDTRWLFLIAAIAILPMSDLALGIVNYLSAKAVHAQILPGLVLRQGVPEHLRTLVAVPTMLTSEKGVDELLDTLEIHYLANAEGHIQFALVTDWGDAETETRPDDRALLERAAEGVRRLNATYGERFVLLHRARRWNPAEGVWMGWERKRGKLVELNRVLRGHPTDLQVTEGRLLGSVRYVIVLDSDTRLPREAARRLVGKLAHPLNRARVGPDGLVARGYGILQPRVTPSLPMAEESSPFQRVYSTQRGLDPYAFAISDVYQDLFYEGSFAGKGIYDIDVVEEMITGRIPDNTVLSHDLLEGSYARSGLVTDVEVVEEHPKAYEVAVSRAHRWTRGDWQLLPWLTTRTKGLRPLGLWKMADNLRRSLAPVALVLGLIVSVAVLPARAALVWVVVLLLPLYLPSLLPIPAGLRHRKDVRRSSELRASAEDLGAALRLGTMNLIFLAHQAWGIGDAVVRTLWRLLVSKRRMLEWTTAAAVEAKASTDLGNYARLMAGGLVAPFVLLVVAAVRGPAHLLLAVVPAALWFVAPYVAARTSTPDTPTDPRGTPEDLEELRVIARRTWHFFDTFVTEAEHHLPPDNFQEEPEPVVAHRTSPTNIGLYLLSIVTARDLGWIGLADATDRIEATLGTVQRLKTHRGHLLNWYDTTTLQPLEPAYVSTVDSGNYAGHLIALGNACREWVLDPELNAPDRSRGLRDGLAVLRQQIDALPADLVAERDRATLLEQLARAEAWDSLAALDTALQQIVGTVTDLRPELEEGDTPVLGPALDAVSSWALAVVRSVDSHRRDDEMLPGGRLALSGRLLSLARTSRDLFDLTDFTFLYNYERNLFSIGYHLRDRVLDEGSYDLLASEARLASFVAVAKGDVRARHWMRLGRTVRAVPGGAALVSWTGSMFEYLMPPLVMRAPSTGLLARTARLAVRRHMDYATELGIPWGMSEAALNARDVHMTYQYSQFGVPDLGLVRVRARNVVVAPYATGLAAMVEPGEAAANYRRLLDYGARGRFGYYESIDFTPERLPKGELYAVVRCFMAHHQGMTIVAIHNALDDGVMRDRFHAEPLVRATELLLQERAPRIVPKTILARTDTEAVRPAEAGSAPVERVLSGAAALGGSVHHLSNGRLSLNLSAAGGSHLRWNGNAITRWSLDRTSAQTGDLVYLRDESTGQFWTTTAMPVRGTAAHYTVRFSDDRASYQRRRGHITSDVEWHVSPESDVAVRRITLSNAGPKDADITVTTYAELVLGKAADDLAHPVFSKMFVRTEYLPDRGAVVATRRRRNPDDQEVWSGHMLLVEPDPQPAGPRTRAQWSATPTEHVVGEMQVETDRARFVGRGRSLREPQMLQPGHGPSGTTGDVLDPIASLTQRVRVPKESFLRMQLWTVVGATRDEVIHLLDQQRRPSAYQRASMLAWTQSQVQLRHLGLTAADAMRFAELAGHVLYPHPLLQPTPQMLVDDAGAQADLWVLGISGDLPIVLVTIDDQADLQLVRELVKAFELWRLKRFAVDLVVVNQRGTSYVEELHTELMHIVGSIAPRTGSPDSSGRIFLLRSDQVDPHTMRVLMASARVLLVARRGDLATQLPKPLAPVAVSDPRQTRRLERATQVTPPEPDPREELLHDNGTGGFTPDGREYVITLDGEAATPSPWMNVVANESFGFHATAEGAGYTWSGNSRDNQITPWRNDPVTTPLSEAFYVRDERTGVVISPTSAPFARGRHVVRHGFGYTRYLHEMADLALDLVQLVPGEDPVKLSALTITNTGTSERTLSVTTYAELVLGNDPYRTNWHIISERDPVTGALLVRNPWSGATEQVIAFDLDGQQTSLTSDRREFLGPHGNLAEPAAVVNDHPLSGRVGAGYDPCAALQRRLTLLPGERVTVRHTLSAGADRDAARELVRRYRGADVDALLLATRRTWDQRLQHVQVSTPDPSFDVVMNGWLLYQTLACRMLARSGYYQASGAYGFRDQLQDSMAVVLVNPAIAREHLLRAAGRQFLEGDVQHWWLPGTGQGVRTRISDDVVWLVHAVTRYVAVTGDTGVLDEQVPFLEGAVLEEGQHESFMTPTVSERTASLYEHAVIALERSFTQGVHGLPLIGGGDWNDGMNRVGQGGKGESVWLGWFTHATITGFLPIIEARGDTDLAERCRAEQARLLEALETHGWDGEWYRRGYFDDGTPLGSSTRPECQIDTIAQSWAVLSGAASPERARQAMDSVERLLVMREAQVARLFTPPFVTSDPDPGYIRSYPPGVRENGGQYTHGATWSIFAEARLGRQRAAGELFALVNPVNHALTAEQARTYMVEPYVVAADVYSVEPHLGRGGWTWYTGSSAWLYRAGLEAILGLRREADELVVEPCLPPEWPEVTVRYRVGAATYVIVMRGDPVAKGVGADGEEPQRSVAEIVLDGQVLASRDRLPVVDDGEIHDVTVTLRANP